ncbi:MAG: type VI secretion system-associated protein TagF [Desulfobacterales bacterium]|jgi:type VI secretion system protein VasJ|nr:type VI secretion system-associated protein TagF [Desulfobacterales bacterium]
MLGLLKSGSTWKWAAFGKHPVVGDYFNAGANDPFFQAFSGWVENGYRQISAGRRNAKNLYSWRFWAKGIQKDSLVCGVGRDSFDTIGRPYPLFIIGTGLLAQWQRNWELLPFACETIWGQMEYLITKRYLDFSQFEDQVRRLPSLTADWSALSAEERNRREKGCGAETPAREEMNKSLRSQLGAPEFLIPFDANACRDAVTDAGIWSSLLKDQDKTAPNATFIGGLIEKSYVAVFKRPLAVQDFIRLWSVESNTSVPNGIQPSF